MPRGIPILPDKMKSLRQRAMLTQEALAARANCSTDLIQKAERISGNPRIDPSYLASILNVLGADVSEVQRDGTQANLAVVREWQDAWISGDSKRLMKVCHPEIVMELHSFPTPDGIGNVFQGKAEVLLAFKLICQFSDQHKRENLNLTCINDLVFAESEYSVRYIPANQFFRTKFVIKFQIRDGKVAAKSVVGDYDQLRRLAPSISKLFDEHPQSASLN